jgi:maltoporin
MRQTGGGRDKTLDGFPPEACTEYLHARLYTCTSYYVCIQCILYVGIYKRVIEDRTPSAFYILITKTTNARVGVRRLYAGEQCIRNGVEGGPFGFLNSQSAGSRRTSRKIPVHPTWRWSSELEILWCRWISVMQIIHRVLF